MFCHKKIASEFHELMKRFFRFSEKLEEVEVKINKLARNALTKTIKILQKEELSPLQDKSESSQTKTNPFNLASDQKVGKES